MLQKAPVCKQAQHTHTPPASHCCRTPPPPQHALLNSALLRRPRVKQLYAPLSHHPTSQQPYFSTPRDDPHAVTPPGPVCLPATILFCIKDPALTQYHWIAPLRLSPPKHAIARGASRGPRVPGFAGEGPALPVQLIPICSTQHPACTAADNAVIITSSPIAPASQRLTVQLLAAAFELLAARAYTRRTTAPSQSAISPSHTAALTQLGALSRQIIPLVGTHRHRHWEWG